MGIEIDLLETRIRTAMEHWQVPGVAIGLLHGDKEYSAGFGVTNVQHPLAVDANTLFQIGSITKTVTATASMRLVERGRLDLDTPIRQYLPDLRLADLDVTEQVTLRHLLTHTGGWMGDFFDDMGRGDDALARYVGRMAELPQLTPLGAIWSYNNAGFCLAGRIIEVVVGTTFESAIQELVLTPLGMTQSFFFAEDVITQCVVAGHHAPDANGASVFRPWAVPRCGNPAGGLLSSAQDQLRYARFHLGGGATTDVPGLLMPQSLNLMQSPLVPAGGMADDAGLAWMLRTLDSVRMISHEGATNGQAATLLLVPERQFALTILTNSESGIFLHREIGPYALQQYLGITEQESAPIELSAAACTSYSGRYASGLGTLEIEPDGAGLVMHVTYPDRPLPHPIPLMFRAEDRVVVADGPLKNARGEFLRALDGRVTWFRFGSRIHVRDA